MDWYSDRHASSKYVSIFSSEIEFIAGLAGETGGIETGGELYGLQTHAGRPVIMYATPPGPKAVHGVAHFQQDLEFLRETNSLLLNEFGIQDNGSWHSHHKLSIKGLSTGDIRSSQSFASRNGIPRLCQFVLTFEKGSAKNISRQHELKDCRRPTGEPRGPYFRRKSLIEEKHAWTDSDYGSFGDTSLCIAVRSFFYSDAGNAQPVLCPIKVIPGLSPIRMALDKGRSLLARRKTPAFPLGRILFESVGHKPSDDKRSGEFPCRLQKQFIRLPLRVQDEATIRYKEGLILLSLPTLQGRGQIIAACSQTPPHPLVAAYYSDGPNYDRLTNVTETAVCHGEFTKLSTMYKRAIRSLGIECKGQQSWRHEGEERHTKKLEISFNYP